MKLGVGCFVFIMAFMIALTIAIGCDYIISLHYPELGWVGFVLGFVSGVILPVTVFLLIDDWRDRRYISEWQAQQGYFEKKAE